MLQFKHLALLIPLIIGCSRNDEPVRGDVGVDTTTQAIVDLRSESDLRDLGPSCVPLFGVPGARTGVGDDQCGPSCGCDALNTQTFTEQERDAWLAWELEAPLPALNGDPYAGPDPPPRTDEVCVAVFDTTNGTYRLETRDEAGDGFVTHGGACGRCSTLQDLVTYMRIPDLTDPVRECGILGFNEGEAANLACLEALGFTAACSQIWYYNTLNTRDACLACDEENSGPVFKHVAGRTRRNSGLASAICRPCDSVTSVLHHYPAR